MQTKRLLTFVLFPAKFKQYQAPKRSTAFPGRLLSAALLCLATCISGVRSFAQITFTATNLTQTQTFDGMTGNGLPSGFAITSKNVGAGSVDIAASSLGSTSTGSSYKFMSGSDYAIGFLNSGSYTSPETIGATLQNNTGATITGFIITFNYEKYRTGSRAWDWTFFGSTNGSTFTGIAAGNQSYAADAANTTSIFPPQSIAKSVTISGLSIAQGSPYYLRWTLTGNGGSTNGQALGIDDVSITAVAAVATCTAPSGLTATNITSTGASLAWGTVTGAAGYEYVVDQNAGNPAAAGTATTGTAYTASGLTPATAYYLHVHTACGSSSFSSWTTIPFTTACMPPSAIITAAGVTAFCAGDSVVLNANTGTGLTYQWKNNGTNIGSATSSSYTAHASGNYKVVVTNSTGCTDSSAATTVTVNPLPTATITPAGATTFCAGDSVVLNANTGAGLTYQWKNNGNNIGSATNNTYTANASGNYKVVVTNGNGCTDSSAATTVTVNALPVATITPAGATTFCAGDSVVLNANTGAGLTYQWKNNGTNIGSATNNAYTANASGNYKVVVTNGNGCTDSSAATTVTVNALPVATITPASTTTFCAGNSVALNANTGAGLTYQWKNNGSNIGSATNNVYTATASGDYKVTVTNGNGCTDSSAATTVTVNALPAATITPASSTTFCTGDSVVLNANTAAGLTYQWENNGGNISGATGNSYTTNASGSYKVVVTNSNGCTDSSAAATVTVNALPVATITPVGATTFCAGNSVVLNANSGAGFTYQWKNNGINISNATNNAYTANASGSYTVAVTNSNGCTDSSATAMVSVNQLPAATITPAGATTFCAGNSVVLNANTGTGLTYQWEFNGTDIPGATNASYQAGAAGAYAIAVSNSNCTATSPTMSVATNQIATPIIVPGGTGLATSAGYSSYQWNLNNQPIAGATAYTYTPAKSGYYTVTVTDSNGCTSTSAINSYIHTSVTQVTSNTDIRLYPNPASTLLHIDAPVRVQVTITSLEGKLVLQQETDKDINIADLATGAYIVRITTIDGKLLAIRKLLKSGE